MKNILKFVIKLGLALVVLDMIYLSFLWLQTGVKRQGEIPVSRFMQSYINERAIKTELPEISWKPVALDRIPERVSRVFVIAEDSHFYVHHGFDINAIKSVIKRGLREKSFSRGASTITQQTAKNLFLYPARSWLRKWHELVFTVVLELTLTKQRILEIYLNIAEFAIGVYGVNAASQHYFGLPVSSINSRQASYLAAALPWPQKHNYKSATKTFHSHANRIYSRSQKEQIPKKIK